MNASKNISASVKARLQNVLQSVAKISTCCS